MKQQLQVTATFPHISSDDLAEFRQLAGESLTVAAGEPGVQQYDWFFTADETTCVVRETYADSEAVLSHLGAVGDKLGRLMELGGGLRVEVFGTPSDELIAATLALQPAVYTYFQGK